LRAFFLCLAIVSVFALTGCTVNHHGMTLPNGSYLKDHVEYYPHGPRYQFSNEAAHLQNSSPDQDVKVR
jgi:major membrane immunogen (membrane-anchored lipoprotein)